MSLIYCKDCGKQISDKATTCPNCGCPVSAVVKDPLKWEPITKKGKTKQLIKENKEQGIACCPRCGSTSLSANKKGFGVGKAVVGAALTGGIGLVAGNIGAKKVRVTCLNCGHQFIAGK